LVCKGKSVAVYEKLPAGIFDAGIDGRRDLYYNDRRINKRKKGYESFIGERKSEKGGLYFPRIDGSEKSVGEGRGAGGNFLDRHKDSRVYRLSFLQKDGQVRV
jgi:hypothetical protein